MRKKKLLLTAFALAFGLSLSVGVVSASAGTITVGERTSSNVALNLSDSAFSVTDLDGNPLSTTEGEFNTQSADFDGSIGMLNDGYKTSWSAICPADADGNKQLGWFVVDMGKTEVVHKLMVSMQHDWFGKDTVIQLAQSADFSDAITIYNNDVDGSLGLGELFSADSSVSVVELLSNFGTAGANTENNGNSFEFHPVAARYLRVTNNQYGDGTTKNYTAVGEIEIYAYGYSDEPASMAEVAPVASDKPAGFYSSAQNIALTSVYDDAVIYYTLDGSVPTKTSNVYTSPIQLTEGKTTISAAVYHGGMLGLPVNLTYTIGGTGEITDVAPGTNVALNKPVSVKSMDMSEDWSNSLKSTNKPDEAGANAVTRINDGSFDIFYALDTSTHTDTGWAIIDFESIYYIDYVIYEAYWDWWMGNNVIELATKADFSDAVRIFNCVTNIRTGVDSKQKGTIIPAGMYARYMRVTNDKERQGTISAFTELQAIAGVEGESAYVGNVAWGKPVSVKSMDMSEDWTNNLHAPNKSSEAGANTADHINDASNDFWYVITTEKQAKTGWAIIDLQAEYFIDYIEYDGYWDWWLGNNKIQIANKADFSDAVTVYDNAGGVQTGDPDGDGTPEQYKGLTIDANVKGRYVRVTNDKEGKGTTSAFTEIKVFTAAQSEGSGTGNIALNKPISVKSMDMSEDWTNNLYAINKPSEAGANTANHINDGSFDFWYAITTHNQSKTGWVIIDLEAVYNIDYVVYCAYHDWPMANNKIQISMTEDFANPVTIYDNAENVYTGTEGLTIDAEARGRYIRFTNDKEGGGTISAFTELQVFAKDPNAPYLKSASVTDVTVPYGTPANKVNLPTSVDLAMSDGAKKTIAVTVGTIEGYDATTAGTYRAKLTVNDPTLNDAFNLLDAFYINVTVAPQADKTALKALIDEMSAYDKEDYVLDSQTILEKALADANAAYAVELVFQSDIDKAYAALEAANNSLIARGDKTALKAELDKIAALSADDYSAASWQNLQDKVAVAQKVMENSEATQTAVTLAVADLQTAQSKLLQVGDKTALQNKYNELKNTENIYTVETWSLFAARLKETENLLAKDEVYVSEVEAMLNALVEAYEGLLEKANTSALQAKITEVESMNLNGYTTISKAALAEELAAAKTVLANSESTQDMVDDALAALEAKVAGLKLPGNKTQLSNALENLGNYSASRYTMSSYNAFSEAKEWAMNIIADEEADQDMIDAALADLQAKEAALKPIANKTALIQAVEAALEVDTSGYSAASVNTFEAVIEYAMSVIDSNDVDQATADEAVQLLQDAQDALGVESNPMTDDTNGCGASIAQSVLFVAFAVVVLVFLHRRREMKA